MSPDEDSKPWLRRKRRAMAERRTSCERGRASLSSCNPPRRPRGGESHDVGGRDDEPHAIAAPRVVVVLVDVVRFVAPGAHGFVKPHPPTRPAARLFRLEPPRATSRNTRLPCGSLLLETLILLLGAGAVVAPRVAVAVEGDRVAAEFLRARLTAAGIPLADPAEADVRVRVRALDNGRLHVVVDDRKGAVADRIVQEADDDETRVAAWDVVRDAVDRSASTTSGEGRRLPLAVDALLTTAPDPTFGATSYWPVGLDVSVRFDVAPRFVVVAGAGYNAEVSPSSSLHALAIHAGAEVRSAPGDVEWAAGARATTTPCLALAAQQKSVGVGSGVGASVTAYGRALFSLGALSDVLGGVLGGARGVEAFGVVEGGVEARLVRTSVLADRGEADESLFAAPLAVGVEVRWP